MSRFTNLDLLQTWLWRNQPATATQIGQGIYMHRKSVNKLIRRNSHLFELVGLAHSTTTGQRGRLWKMKGAS